jgi:hypothetical protein
MQPTYDSKWLVNLENLKAFKHKYNTTKISSGPAGIRDTLASILKWAQTQRHGYNAFNANKTSDINQERIDLLDSIDFAWSLHNKTLHEQWMNNYFKLYWYHSQHNTTNVTLSSGYRSEFLNWISIQKTKYQSGKLDQGKIDLMNELDFDWEPDPSATWEELFEELLLYKGKFGSTLINRNINLELGRWTAEMRKLYAAGDLDPKWTRRLNSLDFKWDAVDVNWNAMVDRLVAYRAKHDSVCVPNVCHDDPPLRTWVSTVREKYGIFLNEYGGIDEDMIPEIAEAAATRRISAELYEGRLRRLHSLGFVWDALEAQWLEMYERLRNYKETYNSTSVPAEYEPDPQLEPWMKTQRLVADNLSIGRIALLDEIGFDWDPLSNAWNEMYEKLLLYKEEHGNTSVPQGYEACPELSRWVLIQRRKKRLGLLAEDRIQALKLDRYFVEL